jgi:hypothetical protein
MLHAQKRLPELSGIAEQLDKILRELESIQRTAVLPGCFKLNIF